jgi:hypothetical protein
MRKSLLLASALALASAAPVATALPCAGFDDVDDTASFCGSVAWLKNRAITLGCTGVSYCPADSVTRAQMALFMNRLGKALTPAVLHREQLRNNVAVGSAPQLICETADYAVPAASFPRQARFNASVWGHPNDPGQAAWLQGWWVVSVDAGASWSPVGTWLVDQFPGRDWADYAQVAGFPVLAPPLPLSPGGTYRFGISVNNYGAPAAYPFNPLVCQVEVVIDNANPATSPLDE